MPPRSLPSAVALIGLSALTAIEAGGCDKRPESLRSISRTALPLVGLAIEPAPLRTDPVFSDYGLTPRPDLKHICGHYELQADGRLTTQDLFVGPLELTSMRSEVERDLERSDNGSRATRIAHETRVTVESSATFKWPRSCPKALATNARTVVVATRVL